MNGKKTFITEAGYPAVIQYVRANCGYIGVPADHPVVVGGFTDDLSVYGGVTWGPGELPWGSAEENELRWVGFDATHGRSLEPMEFSGYGIRIPSDLTDAEMVAECESLAAQLRGLCP